MILQWIKEHTTLLTTILVSIGFLIYCYGCQPRVRSLINRNVFINRQELQLELDQFIGMAQLRIVDLNRQEELRAIVLQNALILVRGQPFNPLGIITAIASVYGVTQVTRNIKQGVKNARVKRSTNNAHT